MMATFIKKLFSKKEYIIIASILLLASYLRLYRVGDYMTFLGDEGRDLLAVKSILEGDLVFLGPRSSAADFYYGPVYFYFITPFLWLFNYDPVGPAVFIAILGLVTVYLVYSVGKAFFNETAGLIAAALYTVSPIVIAYSRSSWNPNPLPFVALLTLYCTYQAILTKSWKYVVGIGFLMGIAIQLQYLALFLGAIVFLFLTFGTILHNKKVQPFVLGKLYLSAFFGFIAGWSPFLAFEIKNGFPNIRTMSNYIVNGGDEAVYPDGMGFFQNIQSVFFKLFGRLVTRFPAPEQVNVHEDFNLQLLQIGTYLLGLAALFALYKVKNKLVVLLFTLWIGIGCFLFGFYKREIYDYYLGFMFPLPFLLIGNVLTTFSFTSKHKNFVFKIVATCIFLALFLWNLDGNPFKYQPNRQKDQVLQIAEFVLSKTDGKPYNFALLTQGNSDHGYRYFFAIHNRNPVEIKNTVLDPKRTSVTDQLLIVCEDQECQPLGNSLWEVAGFGQAEVVGEWKVSVVKVYKLVPYTE